MTTTLPDLATLTDEQLAALCAGADDDTIAAVIAEGERRDAADLARQRQEAASREAKAKYDALKREWWAECVEPEYAAAEAACSFLLSRLGEREGIKEPLRLWIGAEQWARERASEELCNHWDTFGRTGFAEWRRQRGAMARTYRDDLEAAAIDSSTGRSGTDPATDHTLPLSHILPGRMPAEQGKHAVEGADMDAEGDAAVTEPDDRTWPGSQHFRDKAKLRGQRQAAARQTAGLPPQPATPRAELEVRDTDAIEGTVCAPGTVGLAPIDGAHVLNEAYGYLGHMVHWPSEAAQITATLAAGVAHGRHEKTKLPVFPYMSRPFFTSEEGGSGKSRAARITAALCPSPKRFGELTKASLIDLIAERHTVVITELDTLVGATGRRTPWLAGLVNMGYEEDGATSRKQGGVAIEIPLCGPMILDGLKSVIYSTGEQFKTMRSRCIIIEMFPAPEGYRAPKFRGEAKDTAKEIQARLARWLAQEVRDGIGDHEPVLPGNLGSRPADLWEPLFAVAERAGGYWPALARFACERIETAAGRPGEEETVAETIDSKLAAWGASGPSIAGITDDTDGDEFD